MRRLATLKHISSKNADYGAAERYLTYEHDEFSGKEIRDKQGHLIPREEYRMDTLLCGEDDFAIACMKANLRYEKNDQRGDVKSHHYILSFDPRDAEDHGLTIDQAQALGVEFCKKHFPGHQAMIVTHPDGHNHSGNIHTHIVINSLRIEDVPLMPYMDRACDTKAGMKHRCTASCFRYLRAEVMEMCHHHGLHQIDLLNGSKNRVTEKEYWLQRREQRKLDEQSSAQKANDNSDSFGILDDTADKKTEAPTKFETDKEKLRQTLRTVMSEVETLDAFFARLLQLGITVKESRGRYSYLTTERTKPITSRKLGDDFLKEAIMQKLKDNAERKRPSVKNDHMQKASTPNVVPIFPNNKPVFAMRDQTPQPLSPYAKYGFRSKEDWEATYSEASNKASDLVHEINVLTDQIEEKTTLRDHVQHYRVYRETYNEWQGIRREKKRNEFYETHRTKIVHVESAIRYFKEHGLTRLPSAKQVQDEIESMIRQKNTLYQEYEVASQRQKKLLSIHRDIQQTMRRDRFPHHEQQKGNRNYEY